jgi:hypothetical protein
MDLSDAIIKFDDMLADDGEMGAKLRAVLAKSDRTRNS